MNKKSTRIKLLPQDSSSITFEFAYARFMLRCRAMNVSKSTIEYYNQNWRHFCTFCDMYGISELALIDADNIDQYKVYLFDRNIKPVSVQTRVRSLRTIILFYQKNGWLQEFKIDNIKVDRTIKETYSDSELLVLLQKPKLTHATFSEYRNWVIIVFLFSTGCRLKTLINIAVDDVNLDSGTILYTTTKNKRQQIIPIPSSTNKILAEYLDYRASVESKYLFCNTYGNQLTEGGLQHAIRKYNRARGIDRTSIHAMRHTFAKKAIESGMDAFKLQKILGHSSLEMTRNYVNLFSADLMIGYDEVNPFEQFSSKHGINKSSIKLK